MFSPRLRFLHLLLDRRLWVAMVGLEALVRRVSRRVSDCGRRTSARLSWAPAHTKRLGNSSLRAHNPDGCGVLAPVVQPQSCLCLAHFLGRKTMRLLLRRGGNVGMDGAVPAQRGARHALQAYKTSTGMDPHARHRGGLSFSVGVQGFRQGLNVKIEARKFRGKHRKSKKP